jgi:hypothetical protein
MIYKTLGIGLEMMLAFSVTLMAASSRMRARTIEINIDSRDYVFEHGQLDILPAEFSNDEAEPADGPAPPEGPGCEIHVAKSGRIPRGGPCSLSVSTPGRFHLIFANAQITRKSDGKQVHMRWTMLPNFTLTQADFDSGVWNIAIDGIPLQRFQVLDERGRPVGREQVTFQFRRTPITFQVPADASGIIIMFGGASDYDVWIVPSGNRSLRVERLEL